MKIFSKLFKMFLFVIIAPLFITAVFLFQYQKHAKKELLQNYLNIVEISAVSLQNNALNLANKLLNVLENKTLQEQEKILQNQIKENKDILFAALFSEEGKELARAKSRNFEDLPTMNLAENEAFQKIKKGGTNILFSDGLFPPYSTFILKQTDNSVLLLVADFGPLIYQTEQHKIGTSGGLYFLDENGRPVLNKGPHFLIDLSELNLEDKGTVTNFKTNANLTLAGAYANNPRR